MDINSCSFEDFSTGKRFIIEAVSGKDSGYYLEKQSFGSVF